MPNIRQYKRIEIDVDVDVDDFVDECSTKEIKILIECLKEQGHLSLEYSDNSMNILDVEWNNVIRKISGNNRLRLSNEDEDIIRKIANK